MIIPMARIRIMGPRDRLPETLAIIQDQGVLHLAPPTEIGPLHRNALTRAEERRRRQLLRILADIDAVLPESDGSPGAPPVATVGECARWARLARRVRRGLAEADRQCAELEEELALLRRYQGFFAVFESLLHSGSPRPGFSAFHIVLRADQGAALPALRRGLEELLGGACEILERELVGGETAVLLLVPASRATTVEQLLAQTRVQEVPVPSGYGPTLLEAIPRMRSRAEALPSELDLARRKRTELLAAQGPTLTQVRRALHDHLDRMEAHASAAVSPHTFVLDGWLPAGTETKLARALEGALGPGLVLEVIERGEWQGEDAPVVLRNPRLFRPFELLTGMLPLPHYGTIDPTPYVAVFFPMFFGLMLGDAGYGALLGLLALVLHRRSAAASTLRSVAEVAGPCALFAIVFGVMFGEYFGDLGHRWFGLEPLWIDRGTAVVPFLVLTLALGLVHVALGLILAVIVGARHGARQAVGRGLSALMLALIAVAVLALLEVLPHALLTPAVVGLLIGFPILIALEGMVAAVELMSAIGHVLSYARIMALGTASVMLAIVANRLSGAMGSAVVGALFALLFHLVNFGLGLFSPTIHALRLHYVEFFGTFYSPGGTPYTPLGHWAPRPARTV
jgi:V/A-type H+-transporting ATPase subunit I